MTKVETGNWTDYRARFNLQPQDEIDLHFGRRDPREQTYDDAMADVERRIIESLRRAQANGRPYIMFTHGRSTSRPGQVTARSVVRGFMRSTAATPLIERADSIQHPSVFVAKIRPSPLTAS
jgi:hypothetical protein